MGNSESAKLLRQDLNNMEYSSVSDKVSNIEARLLALENKNKELMDKLREAEGAEKKEDKKE